MVRISSPNIYQYNVSFVHTHRASDGESCSPDNGNVSHDASDELDLSTHQRIRIYSIIVAGAILIVTLRAALSYLICLSASRNLHNKMFKTVLRAPVLFFDTNPIGKFAFASNQFIILIIVLI